MPVTVMLTPWEVYTAELVTVRVMVFRDILQPDTRIMLSSHLVWPMFKQNKMAKGLRSWSSPGYTEASEWCQNLRRLYEYIYQ